MSYQYVILIGIQEVYLNMNQENEKNTDTQKTEIQSGFNTRFEDIDNKHGEYITVNLFDTQPQTAANYGIFFIAWHPCEILSIQEVHGTKAGAAATVTVEKLTGTTAKGSGTALITTAFDLTSANNTVQLRQGGDFDSTTYPSPRRLMRGDRLAIKSTGTIAVVKDLQITVYLKPLGRGDYR